MPPRPDNLDAWVESLRLERDQLKLLIRFVKGILAALQNYALASGEVPPEEAPRQHHVEVTIGKDPKGGCEQKPAQLTIEHPGPEVDELVIDFVNEYGMVVCITFTAGTVIPPAGSSTLRNGDIRVCVKPGDTLPVTLEYDVWNPPPAPGTGLTLDYAFDCEEGSGGSPKVVIKPPPT